MSTAVTPTKPLRFTLEVELVDQGETYLVTIVAVSGPDLRTAPAHPVLKPMFRILSQGQSHEFLTLPAVNSIERKDLARLVVYAKYVDRESITHDHTRGRPRIRFRAERRPR